ARNRASAEQMQILGNRLKLEQWESNKRLENELAGLRQAHDELQARLASEQQAAAESGQRADALGSRLRESLAELERAQARPSGPAQEQGDRESDLRAQLHAANAAAERAQAAFKEEGARKKALEERLRILCNSLKLEQVERRKRF